MTVRTFLAGTALVLGLLLVWGGWAYGVPFTDRECHESQRTELARLESTVRAVLPVSRVEPLDQCRLDADAQVIALAPRALDTRDVRGLFDRAGWSARGTDRVSPDGRVYVTWGTVTHGTLDNVEISVQRVGYRSPVGD